MASGKALFIQTVFDVFADLGGAWKYSMDMTKGGKFIAEGVYSEILPLQKIVTSADFKPMTEGVIIEALFEADADHTHLPLSVYIRPLPTATRRQKWAFTMVGAQHKNWARSVRKASQARVARSISVCRCNYLPLAEPKDSDQPIANVYYFFWILIPKVWKPLSYRIPAFTFALNELKGMMMKKIGSKDTTND